MQTKPGKDWETRILELLPEGVSGKKGHAVKYNMKEGKDVKLELETLEDEWSTGDSSSTTKETSKDES